MKRTTISLSDDLAAAADREARRRDSSVSEVARTALAEHLGLVEGAPRELGFAAVGRSGQRATARDMEQLLEHEWNDIPGRR
jgi:predicted transcriptional regulator